MNLRISGPTPLPPEVREAAARQMVSHRSEPFRACIRAIVPRLLPIFGTSEPPLLFTASGTGGMEAALLNTLDPGQRVLAIRAGMFGDRFAEIARHGGLDVSDLEVPWGQAVSPDDLRKRLQRDSGFDAVLVTHNESSTGVCNPLEQVARVVREESRALLLVDAVSSAAGIPIEMDLWGADVVVTVSQKALMSPPGLAILAVSERAFQAAEKGSASYYFDFKKMREAVAEGTTTYTPAVSSFYGLEAALGLIDEEGLGNVYRRHERLALKCRKGLESLGMECFAAAGAASPTITSVLLPEGPSATKVRDRLESEHAVFVAQGRREYKERMLRIGHMGWVGDQEIGAVLDAFGSVLQDIQSG